MSQRIRKGSGIFAPIKELKTKKSKAMRKANNKIRPLKADEISRTVNLGREHDERLVKIDTVAQLLEVGRRTVYDRMKSGAYKLSRVQLAGTRENPTVVRYKFLEVLAMMNISETERENLKDVWMQHVPEKISVMSAAGILDVSPSLIYDIIKNEDPDSRLDSETKTYGTRIRKRDLYKYIEDRTIEA